ncbi:hypothetical protein [Roseobacter sp.]|uniref:hypothetical protein n=1 Tax=Roseobacter sp. TaxID=1907202 RepID=UPI0032977444
MNGRFIRTLATLGAIAAAILSGVMSRYQHDAGPGAEPLTRVDTLWVMLGAGVGMFVLILWACAHYTRDK